MVSADPMLWKQLASIVAIELIESQTFNNITNYYFWTDSVFWRKGVVMFLPLDYPSCLDVISHMY